MLLRGNHLYFLQNSIISANLIILVLSCRDLLSPDLILSDLYPGDHGNTSPNLSNQYELNKFG